MNASGFSLEPALFDQCAHDRPDHEQRITLGVYAIVPDGTTNEEVELAIALDSDNRDIVGWSINLSMTAGIVIHALIIA